jgi:hypothetical protein
MMSVMAEKIAGNRAVGRGLFLLILIPCQPTFFGGGMDVDTGEYFRFRRKVRSL